MSKSGVTGPLLQAIGTVLLFVPGAQGLGIALIAAGSYQSGQYQKRKAIEDYNASLKDRYVMTSTFDGVRSRIYGRARNVDGVLFKATHGDLSQYYTLVVAFAGHEIDAFEQIYFNDQPVSLDAYGNVSSAPYSKTTNRHWTDSVVISSTNTVTLSRTPVAGPIGVTYKDSGSKRGVSGLSYASVSGNVITFDPGHAGLAVQVTYTYTDYNSYAKVYLYNGSATQDISSALAARVPGLVNASHKFSGIALAIVDLEYNQDVFPSGVPNITALIRGAKDVYDPRTSTTGWTDNPALCIRDWALYQYGGGCSTDEINDASIIAAANACDVTHTYVEQLQLSGIPGTTVTYAPPPWYTAGSATIVDFSTGSPGGSVAYTESTATGLLVISIVLPPGVVNVQVSYPSTRGIFRCGYVCKLDVSPETHLAEMVESMGGKWGWAGGQLKVRAGVYQSPVLTIDDSFMSDQGGTRSIVPDLPIADVVNTYRLTIADETQNYAPVQLPALSPSAYLALDGVELAAEIQMGAIGFGPQALHVAGILLREQRQSLTLTWPCNMKAWAIELFDVIQINSVRYGWSAKTFEVLAWQHSLKGGVILTLKETDASIYTPDDAFSALDQADNTALPNPFNVPDVTGLAADSGTSELQLMSDGTIVSRIHVTWDAVQDQAVAADGHIDVGYQFIDPVSGAGPEVVFSVLGSSTDAYIAPAQDGMAYAIRVRARNLLVRGNWCPGITHIVVGKTEPPPAVDNFTISTQADGTRLIAGGYLSANRPVDLAGYRIRYLAGSGSYTWSSMQPFQTDTGFFTTLPVETNLLLAGTYTLGIVGVDTSGNESVTPNFIVATLPNPRLGDVIELIDEQATGWPGVLTDCVAESWNGSIALRARDQATWSSTDPIPSTWAAWTRWVWDPVTSFSYVTSVTDFGSSFAVLPVVAYTASGTVTTEVATSSDGTTWSSWAAIASTVVTRYIKCRITVSVPSGSSTGPGVTPVCTLSALSVSYVGKVTSETGNDLDTSTVTGAHRIGTGNIRLPSSRVWAHISRISVTLQNVSAGWTWTLIDKDGTNGPQIKIYNGSGSLADALIDWTIEGVSS